MRQAVAILAAVIVTGCSTLPSSGPTRKEIIGQAQEQSRFNLIEVDDRVVAIMATRPGESFARLFASYGRPAPPTIQIGDSVAVTILQTVNPALITGTVPGAGTTAPAEAPGAVQSLVLPEQVVGSDGAISIPYGGRVHAAGTTPALLQQRIERVLAQRIVEPQVIVTVPKVVSGTVVVSAETLGTMRVPLSTAGERLLDVIAVAGGSKTPLHETFVRLSRGKASATIAFGALVSNPDENIYAWPGDVITLLRTPQTFEVVGATTNNLELPFTAETSYLASAIARAGGLSDSRADPAGVFLFRYEPPRVVKALGAAPLTTAPDGSSPVIYHLSLHNIAGYFLAQRFPIQRDDVVYVADASSDSVQKAFTLIQTLTGPIIGGVVVTRGTGQ